MSTDSVPPSAVPPKPPSHVCTGPDNGSAVLGGGILGNALVQHTGSYGGGICGTSYGVVACADFWLGEQLYDVIHFNWGLHDICAKMCPPPLRARASPSGAVSRPSLLRALAPHPLTHWQPTRDGRWE